MGETARIDGSGNVESYQPETTPPPPPPQENTDPANTNGGADTLRGEVAFNDSYLRLRYETMGAQYAQQTEDASRQAGADAAHKVQEAIRLGNRNPLEKLFSDRDASQEMARALDIVQANQNDPAFQTAFLETLGAEGVTDLERRLQDDDDYPNVMRNSLSVASNRGTLSADFQRQIVDNADLGTLERLTSDPNNRMSDDFLVAAGKKATTKDIGWKEFDKTIFGPDGSAVNFHAEEIQDHADQLLTNIARSSRTASLALLQDESVVRGGLRMSFLSKPPGQDNGMAELLRAGTSLELRPQHDREINQALHNISEVLRDPDSFHVNVTINGMVDIPKDQTIVTGNVADALAEVYRTNAPDFSGAAARQVPDTRTFDYEDTRTFLGAALEHESTRNTIYFTTQVEAARLMRADADFSDPSSGQARVAGRLIGAYADAYSRTVLKDAADQDKRQALIAGVVNSSISMLGNAAPGLWSVPASGVANQTAALVSEAMKGNAVDKAKEALDHEAHRQQGSAELLALASYDNAARDALNGATGTTAQGRADAEAFNRALVEYNNALAEGEKILDGDGRLINPAEANGAQLERLQDLANGRIPAGLPPERRDAAQRAAYDVNRIIKPTILDVSDGMDIPGGN